MLIQHENSLEQRRSQLSSGKKVLLDKWVGGKTKAKPIPKRSDPSTAPLSFAQQRLWFLDQLMPGSTAYNMHDAVRIQGNFEPVLLRKVLATLVSRHEALRTTFVVINEQPVQIISAPTDDFNLPIDDVGHFPLEEREARGREVAIDEIKKPFDLTKGPLFRARLIRINDKDHILLWVMHHIISDGWSLGLIIKEVLALSGAFAMGQDNPLPPLGIQFGDFAAWQREWLTGPILDAQLEYWRKELGGDITSMDIPFDRPRPTFPSYRGERRVTSYPLENTRALKELALKQNVTLFMVLLGGFSTLLHRYSGMEHIFVGAPIAARNRVELHDLIGFFANTLVLKTEFTGNLTFLNLLEQIRRTSLAAYERQDIPFERLVEELHPKRELNRPPFFQVMLVLQNEPMPTVEESDLKIEPFEIHNGTCKFDVLLNIFEIPEGMNVGIEYNSDLFDADTIERMLEHYKILLDGIVENPNQTIAKLPLIDARERNRILVEWNGTSVDYAAPHTLHTLIERQVDLTPDAFALRFGETRWTYLELNQKANQLAWQLQGIGIGPGAVVGICAERSIELVWGLLGILKAGGAYLPLDMEYPAERLSYMLEDSQAKVLLYTSDIPNWVDQAKIRSIRLTENGSEYPVGNAIAGVTENDLAYVIYTSGSTGRPKGAMNSHRGICNRLLWMQDQYRLTDSDRVLQKTPFSFDVSVWEFFWPLLAGAELVMAPPGAHRDSTWLARIIQEAAITTLHFVPSMLHIFMLDPASAATSSLRRVFCSGEALPYAMQQQFKSKFSAELHNLYGPTEAEVDVTFWDCSQETERMVVPIGRPIANTQIYILDKAMQPVPIGVPGELYIGGVGVGTGYLNKEDLTRERFVPDPYSTAPNSRLYKTGDLARFWKNGVIEFLGRIDSQVKIRGLRIELNEIEHELLQCPGVLEAVVMARDETPDDQRLVAYLVAANESDEDQSEQLGQTGVSEWRMVFEDTYSQTSLSDDPLHNIVGWKSSYTDQEITADEMREWVDVTVNRILELAPRNILEIGCGTGLLLFRLAPHCQKYVGADISKQALQYISRQIPSLALGDCKIDLLESDALGITNLSAGEFDLVILNSVVQYFPSLDYLIKVLNLASRTVRPGGAIFLGDLRNYALGEVFSASVEFYRAQKDATAAYILNRERRTSLQERELLIDPSFFDYLPSLDRHIQKAWTLLRRGVHSNEMCRFRYDALLKIQSAALNSPATPSVIETLSWQETGATLDGLNAYLQSKRASPLLVTDIPNARLWRDTIILQCLENAHPQDDKNKLAESIEKNLGVNPVDPEQLWSTYSELYHVRITWSRNANPGMFDVLFIPRELNDPSLINALAFETRKSDINVPLNRFGNNPGRTKQETMLIGRLKESLKKTLPDYMLPGAFIFLDQFPLLTNGKINRNALPAPEQSRTDTTVRFIAPRSPLEQSLATVWTNLLKVDRIGVQDNFFDLGGHSLLAAQMVLRLREQLCRDIPLRILFQSPTIEGMAEHIEGHGDEDTGQADPAWPQMLQDSMLPADIKVFGPSGRQAGQPKTVFLTGATGFLGVYLLRDILAETTASVLCLVRTESPETGMRRLRKILDDYHLTNEVDFGRIEIIPGDLEKPYFGLSMPKYTEIVESADSIFHCGATVNFLAPYEQLRSANVGGSLEVLRLATAHHIKPVHYISTLYTLSNADLAGSEALCEMHTPQYGERLGMGYIQTKWVAERLNAAARDRGVPVNIYRPGRISGDTLSGACQENDFFWGILRACVMLGSLPSEGFDENLAPVDHVSSAIVKLSMLADRTNRTYHLLNPEPLKTEKLLAALQDFGYKIEALSYADWQRAAMERLSQDPDDPSVKLGGFLFGGNGEAEPVFSDPETRIELHSLGINCPVIDNNLLRHYFKYFVGTGFLPPPAMIPKTKTPPSLSWEHEMNPVVFRQVSKTYQLDKVAVPALVSIDLTIRSGIFTVISGPSGSGKTTLLNLIGCIDHPDQGEIVVAGQVIKNMSDNQLSDFRARHIGFIFQNFNLIPTLTVYENVEYPLRLIKLGLKERQETVYKLLEEVGLGEMAKRRPSELSGGQRQRVAIARALAPSPRIVLADEPTANLDSHTGAAILELMRRMQRERHVSFVFSSHDPQIMAAADEAIIIRDGRIEHHTAQNLDTGIKQ